MKNALSISSIKHLHIKLIGNQKIVAIPLWKHVPKQDKNQLFYTRQQTVKKRILGSLCLVYRFCAGISPGVILVNCNMIYSDIAV